MRPDKIALAATLIAVAGCTSNPALRRGEGPVALYHIDPTTELIGKPRARVTPRKPARPARSEWFPRSGKISSRWSYIVLHHSATETGGAGRFDRYHREANGWDELGYHFVIGNGTDTPDGYVEVGPRWHKQKHGAHCKSTGNYFNKHGIGICLVGDFTKHAPTSKQWASLQALLGFLSRETGIGPRHLIAHRRVVRKTLCPGRFLRVAALRRSLGRLSKVSAATRVPRSPVPTH
ncbi:MAG: peptidoglycan recognition family protein [Phycisphaerae bacterium]